MGDIYNKRELSYVELRTYITCRAYTYRVFNDRFMVEMLQ